MKIYCIHKILKKIQTDQPSAGRRNQLTIVKNAQHTQLPHNHNTSMEHPTSLVM